MSDQPNPKHDPPVAFGWNPAHPIGTCQKCGGEMVYNVPRMGPNGGYVHKETGSLECVRPQNAKDQPRPSNTDNLST